MSALALRPATLDDVPFLVATERLPGYERLVGRWEEARHRAALGQPDLAVLIGLEGDVPMGFAILDDLANPHGNAYLRRIAVTEPGRGLGRRFLAALLARCFSAPERHRVHLDTFVDNARARRAYRAAGFREEGVLREAYRLADGSRASQVVMAILRPEWEALARASDKARVPSPEWEKGRGEGSPPLA